MQLLFFLFSIFFIWSPINAQNANNDDYYCDFIQVSFRSDQSHLVSRVDVYPKFPQSSNYSCFVWMIDEIFSQDNWHPSKITVKTQGNFPARICFYNNLVFNPPSNAQSQVYLLKCDLESFESSYTSTSDQLVSVSVDYDSHTKEGIIWTFSLDIVKQGHSFWIFVIIIFVVVTSFIALFMFYTRFVKAKSQLQQPIILTPQTSI